MELQKIDGQIKYLNTLRADVLTQFKRVANEPDPFGDPKSLDEEEAKADQAKMNRVSRMKAMETVNDRSFSEELLKSLDKKLTATDKVENDG